MAMSKFPYGYMMRNGDIVICETEAAIIRSIFRNRADGKSIHAIAKELFDTHTEHFGDSVKKASCKISKILYDKRYIGFDEYPAIVDEALFYRVQILKGKPYAERKSRAASIKQEGKANTMQMTVYIPSTDVVQMEAELKKWLKDSTDADNIRKLIFDLAAAKYECIR